MMIGYLIGPIDKQQNSIVLQWSILIVFFSFPTYPTHNKRNNKQLRICPTQSSPCVTSVTIMLSFQFISCLSLYYCTAPPGPDLAFPAVNISVPITLSPCLLLSSLLSSSLSSISSSSSSLRYGFILKHISRLYRSCMLDSQLFFSESEFMLGERSWIHKASFDIFNHNCSLVVNFFKVLNVSIKWVTQHWTWNKSCNGLTLWHWDVRLSLNDSREETEMMRHLIAELMTDTYHGVNT